MKCNWAKDSCIPCLIVSTHILRQTHIILRQAFKKKMKPEYKCQVCVTRLSHPREELVWWERELTGNPTATLSSAILFVPACRLTLPVYVNLLLSLVPKDEPVII
jgi:hypothetical protein